MAILSIHHEAKYSRDTPSIAQILWGTNNNKGDNTGVIEFKDFYFLLDAVRIVHRSGAFHDADMDGLRSWFRYAASAQAV